MSLNLDNNTGVHIGRRYFGWLRWTGFTPDTLLSSVSPDRSLDQRLFALKGSHSRLLGGQLISRSP